MTRSLGITVPRICITFYNNTSTKVNFLMKNIHIYCDYDRDSYTSNGRSDSSIANQFNERYKSEKHYSIVAPFDIETIISLTLKKWFPWG